MLNVYDMGRIWRGPPADSTMVVGVTALQTIGRLNARMDLRCATSGSTSKLIRYSGQMMRRIPTGNGDVSGSNVPDSR